MKKGMTILLAAAMLLSLIGGCGQTAAGNSSSARSEAVAATTEQAPETTASQLDAPAEDTSTVETSVTEQAGDLYVSVNYDLPLFEETLELSVFYPSRNANLAAMPSHDSEEFPFWARVQENLNVDLTFQEPIRMSVRNSAI